MNDELYHYGVKGMRWGVRNGSKRPSDKDIRDARKRLRAANEEYDKIAPQYNQMARRKLSGPEIKKFDDLKKRLDSVCDEKINSYEVAKYSTRGEIAMRTLKVTGAVAGIGAAAYVAARSGDWIEAAIKSSLG